MTVLTTSDRSIVNGVVSGDVRSAAAARLYIASPNPSAWSPANIEGAAVVVADNGYSYIRMVDLNVSFSVPRYRAYRPQTSTVAMEQELYTGFQYNCPRSFFHTFEMNDYVAGLSFADEGEAREFQNGVNSCLSKYFSIITCCSLDLTPFRRWFFRSKRQQCNGARRCTPRKFWFRWFFKPTAHEGHSNCSSRRWTAPEWIFFINGRFFYGKSDSFGSSFAAVTFGSSQVARRSEGFLASFVRRRTHQATWLSQVQPTLNMKVTSAGTLNMDLRSENWYRSRSCFVDPQYSSGLEEVVSGCWCKEEWAKGCRGIFRLKSWSSRLQSTSF